MKVKPVKEKKSISYPKLAVLTAAVSLTAALSGCDDLPASRLQGDVNIQESDGYFESSADQASSEAGSKVTFKGMTAVSDDCSSSNCFDESNNCSGCSDTSTDVAIIGEVPESNN